MAIPHLYKYLPSIYVDPTLDFGEILFRNLTYFRQHEGKVRGDAYEGIHKDHPGTDITLSILNTGRQSVGKFAFLNSTNPDHVFAFCLSTLLSKELMIEFECDACIEIFQPEEFIRRVQFVLARKISVHKIGLLSQFVNYYSPSEEARFNIKDPTKLVFAKDKSYAKQEEFRLSFGSRQAFKLIQQIVQPHHDPFDDAINGVCKDRLITIGKIHDIARLVSI